MRSIETSTLKPLGREGVGPWRLGEDRLLRVATGGRPLQDPAEAQAQLEVYVAARAAGASTPDAYEVVCVKGCHQKDGGVADGYGVVAEFVPGVGLGAHILIGSYDLEEAAAEVGHMQRKLHAMHMGAGRDWNAEFLLWARSMATLLPKKVGARLVELVGALPSSDALLHGDLHVGNVVVSQGRLAIIDMEFAGFGDPAIDLAISRERAFESGARGAERLGIPQQEVPRHTRRMWDAHLRGYLGEVSQATLEEADRRIEVLAEVERCGFVYRIADAVEHGLTEDQRRAVAQSAEVLVPLLPRVSRLDLGDMRADGAPRDA